MDKLISRIVGEGDEATSGQIPFTPRAKKVLELSLREALSLGHNYIGTEHILLGLVRENEGVAARVLLDFDVNAEKVRNEVIRAISPSPERPKIVAEKVAKHPTAVDDLAAELYSLVNSFTKAMDAAQESKADPMDELLDNVSALVAECVTYMKNLNKGL